MARVVLAFLSSVAALGVVAPAASAATPGASAGATAGQLTVLPAPGVTLSVDGRPYAGDVVVAPDGNGMDVVDRVGFERYLEGIAEMPSSWPSAALQAQAVAARTYALWTVLTHPAGPGGGQICASDACQVYAGLAKAESPHGAAWVAAVQATRGVVLQYQGQIVEALYGSSDGGRTLYGGVPWLPSVADPQDSLAPEHQWSWSESLGQMAGLLRVPTGRTLVSLVSSSNTITETLKGPDGSTSTVALSPEEFHSLVNTGMPAPAGLDLPLPSYRYSVSTYGPQVRIAGWGDGNGLGLSQYGTLGKALAGWTAAQILAAYYRGTAAASLPPGEMPSTISVTLRSAAPASTIAADGPVRILDPAGRTVVSTAGAGAWEATPGGKGVTLTSDSAVPTIPSVPDLGDSAPVAQRSATPAGAVLAPAAGRSTPSSVPHGRAPVAPTTTAEPVNPEPAVAAVAGGRPAAVDAAAVTRARGTGYWKPAAVLTLAAVVAALTWTITFRSPARWKRRGRTAGR